MEKENESTRPKDTKPISIRHVGMECVTVCAAGWPLPMQRVAQFVVFLQANQVKHTNKKRQKKRDTHTHTQSHTGDVIWESIERKPARCVRHCLFVFVFLSPSPSLKMSFGDFSPFGGDRPSV